MNDNNFVYNKIYDHFARIWVCGSGNTSKKSCIVFDSNFNEIKSWNYNVSVSNFIYSEITGIYEDHLGRMWIDGSLVSGTNICVVLDSNPNVIKFFFL